MRAATHVLGQSVPGLPGELKAEETVEGLASARTAVLEKLRQRVREERAR